MKAKANENKKNETLGEMDKTRRPTRRGCGGDETEDKQATRRDGETEARYGERDAL